MNRLYWYFDVIYLYSKWYWLSDVQRNRKMWLGGWMKGERMGRLSGKMLIASTVRPLSDHPIILLHLYNFIFLTFRFVHNNLLCSMFFHCGCVPFSSTTHVEDRAVVKCSNIFMFVSSYTKHHTYLAQHRPFQFILKSVISPSGLHFLSHGCKHLKWANLHHYYKTHFIALTL